MKWEVVVTEVRHVECHYTVEAKTLDEAKRKAAIGDTFAEYDMKNHGVFHRVVESEPVKV